MNRRPPNNLWDAVADQLERDYGYTDGEIGDMIDAYLSGDASTPPGYYHDDWSVGLSRFRLSMVQVERRQQEQAPQQDDQSNSRGHVRDRERDDDRRQQNRSERGADGSRRGLDARGRTHHPRAQGSEHGEGYNDRTGRGHNLDLYDHQDRNDHQSRGESIDPSRSRSTDEERREDEMRLYHLAAQQRAERNRMNEAQAQLEAEMYGAPVMYLGYVNFNDYDDGSGLDPYGHLW